MILIAHGGAGKRRPSKKALKKLEEAILRGYSVLEKGGAALSAVIEAITVLEDSGVFNAGSGGNLQLDGKRRLDASLMDGGGMGTGAVIGLESIKNPIKAARLVMDSPHRIMTDIGARRIALSHGLEEMAPPDEKALKKLEEYKKRAPGIVDYYNDVFSTVGAVALDGFGDIASGSSTGGVAVMLPGRVGDTPLIGAGVYAENAFGAVTCTGKGEDIIRLALAKETAMRMGERPAGAAARAALKRLLKLGGQAGLLALNRTGVFAIMHTTDFMAAGYKSKRGMLVKEVF